MQKLTSASSFHFWPVTSLRNDSPVNIKETVFLS